MVNNLVYIESNVLTKKREVNTWSLWGSAFLRIDSKHLFLTEIGSLLETEDLKQTKQRT